MFSSPIKFLVVTTMYNCEKWIEKCIESVRCQTHQNWEMHIIDDLSTDKSVEAVRWYLQDPRVNIHVNKEKGYQAKNMVDIHTHFSSLRLARTNCIVICLDGDDWFGRNDIFEILAKEYLYNTDLMMTTGDYTRVSDLGVSTSSSYTSREKLLSLDGMYYQGIRSWRLTTWNTINQNIFLDSAGNWIKYSADIAFLYSMMYAVGPDKWKRVFIPQGYYYNDLHGGNDGSYLSEDGKSLQQIQADLILNKFRELAPTIKTF